MNTLRHSPWKQVAEAPVVLASPSISQVFGDFPVYTRTQPALRPEYATLETLPSMALPVIDYIEQEQPHVIVGCDRGGRLFSLAIHAMWQQTRATPFPTLDGSIHFAKISAAEDSEAMQESLDRIIATSKKNAASQGRQYTDAELHIMFVDDWCGSGRTQRLARTLAAKHNARTSFAIMSGKDADVSGGEHMAMGADWNDDSSVIGVDYFLNYDQGAHLEVYSVPSERAIATRKKIHTAARMLAKHALKNQD